MEVLENIPVELIVPPYVLLRLVDKSSLDYLELRDSIAAHGFLCSLCVRPSYRQPGKYEIIEGVHRFCCALDLELRAVPCIVKDQEQANDAYLLDCQVEANAIRHDTKPLDYATRLKSYFVKDPDLTMEVLSQRIHKRPAWIKQMLKLNNLSLEAKKQLDDELIPLGAAYLLAKLPFRVQDDLLPKAAELPVEMFTKYVRSFNKSFRESIKQGRLVKYLNQIDLGKPFPILRTINQIKTEYNNLQEGPLILKNLEDLPQTEVWKMALAWTLHLDPISADKFRARAINKQKRRARVRIVTDENQ